MGCRGGRRVVAGAVGLSLSLAASAVGIATASAGEEPVTAKVSSGTPLVDVSFSPKALSRSDQTPIALTTEGEVRTLDGSPPPAIRELTLEYDKGVEFHTVAARTCGPTRLPAPPTMAAPGSSAARTCSEKGR